MFLIPRDVLSVFTDHSLAKSHDLYSPCFLLFQHQFGVNGIERIRFHTDAKQRRLDMNSVIIDSVPVFIDLNQIGSVHFTSCHANEQEENPETFPCIL